ncbi:odorant receptor 13a-like [Pseudomyrmex gracilis]|uniref:odorant receptor 13a-like n=1 Tax=Pseudomyrmex gracilis TaxID=219809 RepID=UPI0009952465|nr:odorant receptor 13a-like [Pseudomyrmex gracilis]
MSRAKQLSEDTMESARNYYYGITRKMLSISGQWPYQKRRAKVFGVTLITSVTLSLIVPQVCKLIYCDKDVQCILGTTPSFLLTNMILLKLYTCQFNSNKIRNLTDQLTDDWKQLRTREEFDIMTKYAANGRQISLIYSFYCYTACGLFVWISVTPRLLDIVIPLNESRPLILPYEAHYFVDDNEYFFHILIHSFVSVEVGITGVLAHDCMLITYIEHTCSVFAVAGFRFENLHDNKIDKNIDVRSNSSSKIYNRRIGVSMHAHWRALQFADLLEDTFNITFVLQIAIVCLGMSITLLQIAMQSNDVMEAARYVAFIIGQLIHLFCFSVQGQRLIDHSMEMRDKVYNCTWYNIPVKSQKLLLQVMRKSLQPNVLTAGKIYVFSLKSFTTIVQTSMSYFTVLSSFQ